MSLPLGLLLFSGILLTACATSSPNGRAQVVVPSYLSGAYSEFDMQFQLAGAAQEEPCRGAGCADARAFDMQVARLGSRLSRQAFDTYPDLQERIANFEFIVVDKSAPGSNSSANGKVVVFRGIRKLRLDEAALAFIIAREMGHVIAGHHDENSAVSILFSVLAQVLLPVASLARGAAMIIQTSSVATATATSTASYVGSRMVKSSNWDGQSAEADSIAFSLVGKLGWSAEEVKDAVAAALRTPHDDPWLKDLRVSAARCDKLPEQPSHVAETGLSPCAAAASEPAQQEAPRIDGIDEFAFQR